VPNLISNGDFEVSLDYIDQGTGIHYGPSGFGTSYDTTEKHSGTQSVKVQRYYDGAGHANSPRITVPMDPSGLRPEIYSVQRRL
jgi:hypothetical protein